MISPYKFNYSIVFSKEGKTWRDGILYLLKYPWESTPGIVYGFGRCSNLSQITFENIQFENTLCGNEVKFLNYILLMEYPEIDEYYSERFMYLICKDCFEKILNQLKNL